MPLIDDPEAPSSPGDGEGRSVLTRERASRRPTRMLLLACLPAVAVGLLIRVWVMHTSLLSLNSDEGITGLQAFEVLDGRFRLVVAGNEYGATTESYLMAPILHFWTGVWPLRVMATALSALAAFALYRLARPFLERTIAATLALIGWTTSGAFVLLWSRAYMGYNTGFIAQVIAIALACHAIRNPDKLARTAVLAGFAAGFATWSHPMFGVVAVLALIAPSVYHWRRLLTWWLPAAAGGVLGVLPWLLFIAQHGWPTSALATVPSTYEQRVVNFFTELLPRMFGLLAPDGDYWLPSWLAVAVATVLIAGSLTGLVLLVVRRGAPAVPLLVAGVLAFPFLAVFKPLGFVADGRYALPLLPMVLMGLGAWFLLLPEAVRRSPWLIVTVPTIWALVLCVPVIHQQVGWRTENPDQDAQLVVGELAARDIHYLAGDYWGTYLADYLADGQLTVAPDVSVRLSDEAAEVNAADPTQVALVYTTGVNPTLRLPAQDYQLVRIGVYDLYLP